MIRCYVTDRRRGDIVAASVRAVSDGVDMIQVREKDLAARELLALVAQIREIASGSKTKVLVNDRVDVALAAGSDGVHLPSDGLPPARVRLLVNILGVSTHTLEQAIEAEATGADFIVFGPIFETPGKKPVGLEPLREIVARVRIPVLAIGGVTLGNVKEIASTGASGVAGIRMFQ